MSEQRVTDELVRQLTELATYAANIYQHVAVTQPCPNWRPCDDVNGLLSQLSNTLRGIHDATIHEDGK